MAFQAVSAGWLRPCRKCAGCKPAPRDRLDAYPPSRGFFALRRSDFLQNLDNASAAFDGIVEMKNEMRRIFHGDVTGKLSLQCCTMRREFVQHTFSDVRSKDAHKYVRVF